MSDPSEDLTHRSWRYPEFIAAVGKPYTPQQALQYFAESPFWDKQSNNQVIKMQTTHVAQNGEGGGGGGGQEHFDEAAKLRNMPGVEFAVVHSRPPGLWIIHKRQRLSPEEVRPIAAYFILNEIIYQSPDLYNILSASLVTSLHYLRSSLDTIRAAKPAYTARTGYSWLIAPPKEDSDTLDTHVSSALPNSSRKTKSDTQDVLPLLNAFQTTTTYITALTSLQRQSPDPNDDAEAGENNNDEERGEEGGGARERESATPGGGGKGKGGGKAKRRRKSRALTGTPRSDQDASERYSLPMQ